MHNKCFSLHYSLQQQLLEAKCYSSIILFILNRAKFQRQRERHLDSTNYVNNLTYPPEGNIRGSIKNKVTSHAMSTALHGSKTGHPDDENRLTTRFMPRSEALKKLDVQDVVPQPPHRSLGFLAVKLITPYRAGVCSRAEFRQRWKNPGSWYRTTEEDVRSGKFWRSVRELLPGENVNAESEFLASFVDSVKAEGFMSFDTEREVHPVMTQVSFCFLRSYKQTVVGMYLETDRRY